MSYEEKAKAKAHAPSKKTKFGELKEAEDADCKLLPYAPAEG